MSRLKWSKDHTLGLLIGVISPLVFVPVVILIIGWMQDYDFSRLWDKFSFNYQYQIRIITISIISNLIWFYMFLNRERYNVARGIIIGAIAYAPYIVYIKFF